MADDVSMRGMGCLSLWAVPPPTLGARSPAVKCQHEDNFLEGSEIELEGGSCNVDKGIRVTATLGYVGANSPNHSGVRPAAPLERDKQVAEISHTINNSVGIQVVGGEKQKLSRAVRIAHLIQRSQVRIHTVTQTVNIAPIHTLHCLLVFAAGNFKSTLAAHII